MGCGHRGVATAGSGVPGRVGRLLDFPDRAEVETTQV